MFSKSSLIYESISTYIKLGNIFFNLIPKFAFRLLLFFLTFFFKKKLIAYVFFY